MENKPSLTPAQIQLERKKRERPWLYRGKGG